MTLSRDPEIDRLLRRQYVLVSEAEDELTRLEEVHLRLQTFVGRVADKEDEGALSEGIGNHD